MALVEYTLPTQPTRSTDGYTPYRNGQQIAMRARSYPVVPKHLTRNPALNLITQLSVLWEQLTNTQRAAWGEYAYNSPLTDAWSAPRYVRGYAHYLRSNRPRLQWSLPRIDDGPTVFGFPEYTLPSLILNTDNTSITITPEQFDDWANEDGAYLLTYISQPTSPARTYAPETYRPLALIPGSSTSPPGPITLPLTGLPTGPTRVWVRSAVTRADGRYTSRS